MTSTLEARLPQSVEELLALSDDSSFVECAYLVLLGRPVDPAGRDHYLRRVIDGGSRHRIVAELAISDEARYRTVHLSGLQEHLAAYRMRKRLARFAPAFWSVDKFSESERDRRRRRKPAGAEALSSGVVGGHAPGDDAHAVTFAKLRRAVKR